MPYISRCYVECGRTARVTNWEQDACWLFTAERGVQRPKPGQRTGARLKDRQVPAASAQSLPGHLVLDVNRTLQSAGSSSGSSSSKSRRAQSNSAFSLSPDLGVSRPPSDERADVSFKNRFRGMAKSSSADLTIPDENDLIPCCSGIREDPEQAS